MHINVEMAAEFRHGHTFTYEYREVIAPSLNRIYDQVSFCGFILGDLLKTDFLNALFDDELDFGIEILPYVGPAVSADFGILGHHAKSWKISQVFCGDFGSSGVIADQVDLPSTD